MRICLTMIVKNEVKVIARCLDSVRPIADCWSIVDTGSTDETTEVLQGVMDRPDFPGALHVGPWLDFATNRTQALRLAEDTFELTGEDYHLIMDADDLLSLAGIEAELGGFRERLVAENADAYRLPIRHANITYHRPILLKADGKWVFRCPVHEFADRYSPTLNMGPPAVYNLEWPVYCFIGGGGRSQDPAKYKRDAELLLEAIQQEQDPGLLARMTFYLAQSYRDAGMKPKAVEWYRKRFDIVDAGFWQERYVSAMELAKLMRSTFRIQELAWMKRAFCVDPSRGEAPFWLAKSLLADGSVMESFLWASYAAAQKEPENSLFSERQVYEWAGNLAALLREQIRDSYGRAQ